MKVLKRLAVAIDTFFEWLALLSLLSMVRLSLLQVFTRKLFNFVFFWSEEITLLLLVWFSFMGIAIGFREKLHLAIDSFTHLLPKAVNRVLDKIIDASVFAFGIYLVVQGWDFTVIMNESTLPAPSSPTACCMSSVKIRLVAP